MQIRLGIAIAVVCVLPAGVGSETRVFRPSDQQKLNYQLFQIAKDLRETRGMLADTIDHLNDPQFGRELLQEMVPLRLKQIHKSLRNHGNALMETRILCQVILDNDLKGQTVLREDFSTEVCRPLDEILDFMSGDLANTEQALQKFLNTLADQESRTVLKSFDHLIKRIDYLVYASDVDGNNSVLRALVEIESEQTMLARRLMRLHESYITRPFRGLLLE